MGLARPFELGRVRLLPGPLLEQTELNRKFLLAQDPDRLLHMFRVTAGIPSTAEPLGGWEAPVNELRGHYTGHYLSACALMAAQGDGELKTRGDRLVAELAKCQQPNGYLSAFPEEFFPTNSSFESVTFSNSLGALFIELFDGSC